MIKLSEILSLVEIADEDVMIVNPKTGNKIHALTALNFPKNNPAYKLAMQALGRTRSGKNKDAEKPKEKPTGTDIFAKAKEEPAVAKLAPEDQKKVKDFDPMDDFVKVNKMYSSNLSDPKIRNKATAMADALNKVSIAKKDLMLKENPPKNLDKKKLLSLDSYKSSEYVQINGCARENKCSKKTSDALKDITEYIDSNPLHEDTSFYRGIDSTFLSKLNLKEGSSFSDNGVTSITVNPSTAVSFSKGSNAVLKINCKKGQKCAPMPPTGGSTDRECEFLLPPKTAYKVSKIIKKGKFTVYELECE